MPSSHNLVLLYPQILDEVLHTNFLKKVPNKQEFQQFAFNQSLDIDFKDFINLYTKCTAKSYSFLVIDATFASDNLSRFRTNLVERM